MVTGILRRAAGEAIAAIEGAPGDNWAVVRAVVERFGLEDLDR